MKCYSSSMKVILSALAGLFISASVSAQVTVQYYHLDAIGNVLAVTDNAGAVVEQHDYDVFGQEVNVQPGTQPKRFTGKERDVETGWDYFGARYYGSKIGRFTTIDPVYTWRENLVDPQRWNRYAYARNNPLRYVDPDGRQTVPQPGTLDQIIAYFYQVVGLNYQPAVVVQEGQRPQTVGMPDKKTIGQAMIVVGAAAVLSDILAGAERGKESKYTAQYRKEGGFEQANRDFEALSPQDVKDRGKGIRTGVLESGDKVVVRPQSSEGSPTLEIQRQNDKTIKVRYPEPKPIEPK